MSKTTQISADAGADSRSKVAPILVGYDGSDGGHDALELARVLGAATEASCEVGTCLLYGPVSVRRAVSEAEDVEMAPLFAEAREALEDPGAATHIIGARSPGRMLTECAGRIGAGTLVVGAPHLSNLGRSLLGSVAERVLHRAPCEVAVAPGGYADTHHKAIAKVAIAFDGTAESKAALRRAEEIARGCGASIEILVAEDPVVAGVEAAKGDEEREADRKLTSAPAVLSSAVRSVDPAIEADGRELNPGWRQGVSEIAKAIAGACDPNVDLLVAGARKKSDRLWLGSVTKRLIHTAPCPVLVVPHP
jgi:nucleotide-binding universal stress UspA family protein